MKATGVVRRIDDLGRIVVPKEVRRTMRIKEGESLEIFVDGTDKIVLKKYSPVQNVNDFVSEFVDSIYASNKKDIVITDNEKVIAVAGNYRKDIIGRRITLRLEDKIQKRNTQVIDSTDKFEICENIGEDYILDGTGVAVLDGIGISFVYAACYLLGGKTDIG